MRKRPFTLVLSTLLFLYFPLELVWKWQSKHDINAVDVFLHLILPIAVLIGLLRISKFGWYTLIGFVSLWGINDLYEYYSDTDSGLLSLFIHISIYGVSLAYFINPRIRHLYFDPKMRWWRTKRRFETHLPLLMNHDSQWYYPILQNISEGGCFVQTPHLLDLNSVIQIAIPLPIPLNVSVIKAEGEVRWISKNPLRQGMGIQFKTLEGPYSQALREFVRLKL